MNNLLIHKYKPQTIDELLLSNTNKYLLNKYLKNSYFNLILEGESGCGKSSLINIIIKHYYNNNNSLINNHVCYISLLRDQGINFYKNEVKIFINNCIANSYKKIIVIFCCCRNNHSPNNKTLYGVQSNRQLIVADWWKFWVYQHKN